MITQKILPVTNCFKIFKYQKNITLQYRSTSAIPLEKKSTEIKQTTTESPKTIILKEKKPARQPFVKKLFLGQCDTEILAYPEVLNNEELTELSNKLQPIENYFSVLDSNQIDRERKIDSNKLIDIEKLGLLNTYDENETKRCRIQEIIADNQSLLSMVAAQQNLGLRALIMYGSKVQKKMYLEQIMNGQFLSAFCLLESIHSLTPAYMNTKADLDDTETYWIINGEKNWVVNGSDASVFIVFAQVQKRNHKGQMEDTVSAFLVDSTSPGITINDSNPLGVTASNLSNVKFNNVKIPKENLLGVSGKGTEIAMTLLQSNRLYVGSECVGILRNCMIDVIDRCIHLGSTECKVTDLKWAKNLIAHVAVKTYAIESMTYLTAGLIDTYKDQDTELEKTIVKIFSSENCLSALDHCVQLYGPDSYNKDHKINRLIRDTRRHIHLDESNSLLKHYVALVGLQFTGNHLADVVKKVRNPLFHPGYAIKKLWEDRGQAYDQPHLHLNLEYYFHPSLRVTAQFAEYSLLRLKYATQMMLARYGRDVIHEHIDLERLANTVIDVYAMIAVISRASRSYCIGLQNADYEMLTATTFCVDAMARVQQNVTKIVANEHSTNDMNYLKLGDKLFNWKKYHAEHPIKRNF